MLLARRQTGQNPNVSLLSLLMVKRSIKPLERLWSCWQKYEISTRTTGGPPRSRAELGQTYHQSVFHLQGPDLDLTAGLFNVKQELARTNRTGLSPGSEMQLNLKDRRYNSHHVLIWEVGQVYSLFSEHNLNKQSPSCREGLRTGPQPADDLFYIWWHQSVQSHTNHSLAL